MGREFGKLARVRHVITYSLSPFEQRAFPHYFSKGIPNVLRRTQASVLRVVPRECRGAGRGWWGGRTPVQASRRSPCAPLSFPLEMLRGPRAVLGPSPSHTRSLSRRGLA